MRISVRRVDPSKPQILQALKSLHDDCFAGTFEPEWADSWWWLAFHGKTPIGFCGMSPSARWERTGYFTRAGVTSLFQGKGIQKRLIRARMMFAKKLNYTHVVTDTRDNPASANSLIRCGFKMYQPRHPWGFKESVYWIRKL